MQQCRCEDGCRWLKTYVLAMCSTTHGGLPQTWKGTEGPQLVVAEGPLLTAVSTPNTVTGTGLLLVMLTVPATTP